MLSRAPLLAYLRAMAIVMSIAGLINLATLYFTGDILLPWLLVVLIGIAWPIIMTAIT